MRKLTSVPLSRNERIWKLRTLAVLALRARCPLPHGVRLGATGRKPLPRSAQRKVAGQGRKERPIWTIYFGKGWHKDPSV